MTQTLDELREALASCKDVDARDEQGRSLLLSALAHGGKAGDKKKLVQACIKAGADLELRDDEGWSALDLATHDGSLPLIRLLVKKGAAADGRDDEGRSALMKLNQTNSKVYKVVALLVELGADPNGRCRRGRTPMMYAALGADHLGMSCFALQAVKARVDIEDNDGQTVITLCEKENRSMLRMLHRNLAEQTGAANQMPDRGVPGAGGYLPPG